MQDKRAKGLRDLLMTMVISFPALINVGSLLGLLIFMSAAGRMPMPVPALLLPPNARPEPSRRYAVLGVQLFTFVRHDEEILTDDRNFDDFGHALLTLFQAREQSPPHIHHLHLHLHLPHPPRDLSVTSPLIFPELDGRRLVGDDARLLHPPARLHRMHGGSGRLRLAVRGRPILRILPVSRILRLPQSGATPAIPCTDPYPLIAR